MSGEVPQGQTSTVVTGDGHRFTCWTISRGMPVWVNPRRVPVSHDDVLVVELATGRRPGEDDNSLDCYIEDDHVVVFDSNQWNDDGVRVRLEGWSCKVASVAGGMVNAVFMPKPCDASSADDASAP